MKNRITIRPNPAQQERDNQIKEISFWNRDGDYFGLLMSLRFHDGNPVIDLYRIDEGITVHVSKERDKRT